MSLYVHNAYKVKQYLHIVAFSDKNIKEKMKMQKIFAEFSIVVDENTTIEITIWKENTEYEISSKVIKTERR